MTLRTFGVCREADRLLVRTRPVLNVVNGARREILPPVRAACESRGRRIGLDELLQV